MRCTSIPTGPLALYARAACRKLNKRFTMTFHNQIQLYAEIRLGAWARVLVEKFIYRFYAPAALTLVTTPTAKAQLLGFGLSRVAVWPLGVDQRFFMRGVCPRAFEKPVFLFLGRIAPEKNIREFLRAKLPGTKVVVGDGPDRQKLATEFPGVIFPATKPATGLSRGCVARTCLSCLRAPIPSALSSWRRSRSVFPSPRTM